MDAKTNKSCMAAAMRKIEQLLEDQQKFHCHEVEPDYVDMWFAELPVPVPHVTDAAAGGESNVPGPSLSDCDGDSSVLGPLWSGCDDTMGSSTVTFGARCGNCAEYDVNDCLAHSQFPRLAGGACAEAFWECLQSHRLVLTRALFSVGDTRRDHSEEGANTEDVRELDGGSKSQTPSETFSITDILTSLHKFEEGGFRNADDEQCEVRKLQALCKVILPKTPKVTSGKARGAMKALLARIIDVAWPEGAFYPRFDKDIDDLVGMMYVDLTRAMCLDGQD